MPPCPRGSLSVPRTACGLPRSARATLMTTSPLLLAASRYRPSGVSVSPTASTDAGRFRVRRSLGAKELVWKMPIENGPLPLGMRVTKARWPRDAAASPNG